MKLKPLGNIIKIIFFLLFIPYNLNSLTITGELKQYHKTTITFDALDLFEAPTTYLDYRMNVTITAPSGTTYVVPKYFAADVIAPTTPSRLVASNITDTTVDLTWSASTDLVGVVVYRIYNSGSLIATFDSSTTSRTVKGLMPDTAYNLTVRGVDLASNEGGDSNTENFTANTPVNYANVLHFTKAAGYNHGTKDESANLMDDLVTNLGITYTTDDTGDEFNSVSNLNNYDIIFFSNTSGNFLNSSQRANLETWASNGGHFISTHAAADAYGHSTSTDVNGNGFGLWDWYAENVTGCSIQNNPNHTAAGFSAQLTITNPNTVLTNNITFPYTEDEEYYYWEKGYVDGDFTELIQVADTGASSWDDPRMAAHFYNRPDGGRSFYTSLGHDQNEYDTEQQFTQLIQNAVVWCVTDSQAASVGVVTGDLEQYNKTTITFPAVSLSEAPATYLDYRMNVTITSPSSATYIVPGYFAADGNAAETSATSGDKWKVHFNPEETGTYTYAVSFRTGTDIAIDLSPTAGTPTSIDGDTGTFTIAANTATGNDFRAKGKLQYTGGKVAQFDNGDYYLEVGADSPETFLEYGDFDGTTARHDYAEVASNYVGGDPSWQSGKGTEIIGAVNYLANQGMNINYFLTMNITGDGQRAYPFPTNTAYQTYDCSKLDQWQIVFDHMYNKGIAIEMVFTEQENLNWFEMMEGSSTSGFGISRKLYYREMIARFGYLNLFYNIGEEANEPASGDVYTAQQIEDAAEYVQDLSPYNDLVTVHNGPSANTSIFNEIAALSGTNHLTSISRQADWERENQTHEQWSGLNAAAVNDGTKWVMRLTEPYGSSLPDVEDWTNTTVWGSITGGAVGVHYFSYNGDVNNDDYTTYSAYYQRMKYMKDFFIDNNIPFWNMNNDDANISTGYLLSDGTNNFVGYFVNGGTNTITIAGSDSYSVKWYDPRNGGSLQYGSVTSITGGTNVSLGTPPNNITSSWVVYIKKESSVNIPVNGIIITPENTQILVGATTQLTATIAPANASNTSVTWSSSNNTIATVDANGLVTGIAQGNVTITATTNDGGFTDTATVTVNPQNNTVSVTGVTVSPQNAQILVGATTQLTATIAPANASNTSVTWSSSNNTIATVDANGLVIADSIGTVTITVTTSDGNFSASVLVIVISDGSNEDNDNDLELNFRIYPNPANSSDKVYISGFNEESYIVSLFDMVGKLIKKKDITLNNRTGEFKISFLKSGMYFLTVGNENSLYSTKLIVK